ncbi:MBL fold metallo-hydrolase [Parvularcula oceani]|uniref:MBL fold metallo-hydrolase n=1 Tax=Parvularcula oceani TaxID=1247963 RepID=UPI00068CB08C|nr:MBL fold metallo-hydrolase [Parvularcula oceani]
MTRLIASLLAGSALAAPAAAHSLPAQNHDRAAQPSEPEQVRESVADGLYVITGRGGNILFSTGEDGTFVVDDQFADIADTNLQLIEEVSDGPVVFVLNTHYHGDHTGGNADFTRAGATIVSHDNVRRRLSGQDGTAGSALPVITFSEEATFHWNGQPIRAVALPDAHTDGDAMVYFAEADILHTGDVFFSGRYPYIDVEAGGSVAGMIAGLERIAEVAGPETRIVPGHGPVSTRADVEEAIEVLTHARDRVQARIDAGDDREAVIAADLLGRYDDDYAWRFITAERMAGQVYDALTAEGGEPAAAAARSDPLSMVRATAAERRRARQEAGDNAEGMQPSDPVEPAVPPTAPDTVSPTPNRGG